MPTAIVLLVVLWRPRHKRGLRDLAGMFMTRGFVFTRETVRDWEPCFGPLLADHLRAERRGTAGGTWHAAETYRKVDGRWCYRYRAIDRDGNLVEALLGEQRDMDAARRFFARAVDLADRAPERVTTDGHDASPRASRATPGPEVQHRTSRDENNRIAQDHRGIEQRHYPLRGFGAFASAARFCTGFEEQRQYFRAATRCGERVPLADRRRLLRERWAALIAELAAA
jgi:putative transposase